MIIKAIISAIFIFLVFLFLALFTIATMWMIGFIDRINEKRKAKIWSKAEIAKRKEFEVWKQSKKMMVERK